MIRKLQILSLTFFTFLFLVIPTYAQVGPVQINPCNGTAGSADPNSHQIQSQLCNIDASKTGSLIRGVIVGALVIAAIMALFVLIWGGIKWILSGGDKTKVEGARNTIIAAIIGLVITFLAYFILTIVLGLFGISLNNLELPQLI